MFRIQENPGILRSQARGYHLSSQQQPWWQQQQCWQQPLCLAQQQLWRQQQVWRQQKVWRRARGCAARVLLCLLAPYLLLAP